MCKRLRLVLIECYLNKALAEKIKNKFVGTGVPDCPYKRKMKKKNDVYC